MSTATLINISVPQALGKQIEAAASEEKKSISAVLREALRVYRSQKDWAKIRRWGDATAKKVGIKSYDDIERIAG